MTVQVVPISVSDIGVIRANETVSVQAIGHIWLVWAEIAIDHEHAAKRARTEAAKLRPEGSSEFSEALMRELRASMVAVSAASHAIDAFYGAVKIDNMWKQNRTARRAVILETLKLGFNVGKVAQRWHGEFRWLFDLRDGVVHPEEKWLTLQPHPVGGNMAPVHSCTPSSR